MGMDGFARVGAATLAAGLALAGPHAAVAAADAGGDGDTAAPAQSRSAAATPGRTAGRTAGTAAPRAAAGGRSASRVARAAADRQSPDEPTQAAHAVAATALMQPAPQRRVTPRRAVAVAGSDPAAPAPSPSPSLAPAAAGGAAVAPAASASAVPSAATAGLTAVFDLIGHWLSDLPRTPGTDVLTGALLLVRRALLPQTGVEAGVTATRQSLATAAPGTSPVLTGITSAPGSTTLVLSFSTPLVPDSATDLANYAITAPALFGDPKVVTRSGQAVRILAAEYADISDTSSSVTLTLARPLWPGLFYRIFINGELPISNGDPNSNPLTGIGTGQTTFDGDNDATPGGDFWGLFGVGSRLRFCDSSGDRVALAATGGEINVWRELNGDINQITALPGTSAVGGSVIAGRESTGTVYIGSVTIPVAEPLDLNGAADNLPASFVVVPPAGLTQPPPVATQPSPMPVLATSQNLPYTLNISPVIAPGIDNLPGIQSAVYAATAPTSEYPSGLWVVFGGRTNGLHNFSPSGEESFPPSFQNSVIYVINPVDWQVWSLPWSQTDVPASISSPLSSTSQQSYQRGDTLYTIGGYSIPGTVSFTGSVSAPGNTITVTSGLENLRVGQSVSGVLPFPSGQDIFPPGTKITAISGNAVTTSNPAETDATGASFGAYTRDFTTYDTLTALSVSGLAEAVINGGDVTTLAGIRQISDPRLGVAGGGIAELNGRTYLVFGHNFQGGYRGVSAGIAQVYTDEIRSFYITDTGSRLGIAGYQAQHDSVNFRRRDGNLVSFIDNRGRPQLAFLGGVFTPDGNGYRAPIIIGRDGSGRVDASYQQFFNQYTTASIGLYDPRNRSMYTILIGGISLYSYSDGQLTEFPDLPWVDNVTSLVRSSDGSFQEYIMSPIPAVTPDSTGNYGANAAYFQNQALPAYTNGVIKLNTLSGPTVLGYMYGGIYSTVAFTPDNTFTATGASNQVFQIVLTPTGAST